MRSFFKHNKTLKRTIIPFFEQSSEGCLQQSKDCEKRVFIMFPTVFCINFTMALSFLIQICTRTDEVGKITGVFVRGFCLLGAFCKMYLRKARVRVSCFLIPQIF